MAIKKTLFAVLLFLSSSKGFTQRMCLNQVVDKVYGAESWLKSDSLLFVVSDCLHFIYLQASEANKVKIVSFKNEDDLVDQLRSSDQYLLKVSLLEIKERRLLMRVSVHKINQSLFTRRPRFLVFHDERVVECVFDKKKNWIFSRTVSSKSHLTE